MQFYPKIAYAINIHLVVYPEKLVYGIFFFPFQLKEHEGFQKTSIYRAYYIHMKTLHKELFFFFNK